VSARSPHLEVVRNLYALLLDELERAGYEDERDDLSEASTPSTSQIAT
jgi:hypothetical protein